MRFDEFDLAYGRDGLRLRLERGKFDVTQILPKDLPGLSHPEEAFKQAVAKPINCAPLRVIAEQEGKGDATKVVIVISDHTRPVPDKRLVPWLVDSLGLPDSCISILVGTGTHRGSTAAELLEKLGEDNLRRFKVVNHDCHDTADLTALGTTSCGGKVLLNRLYCEADIKLCTGFIEPHFFAGFSGGPKAIMPGIAGNKLIFHFHRAALIGHPLATWGELENNPLQQLAREAASFCPPDFIVNVTLNREREISGIFAGEMLAAHAAGCGQARAECTVPVSRRFPVVVTTNSGYPLDQNFYQTVKGISAATGIVESGGAIVVASECCHGLPAEGNFAGLLRSPLANEELQREIQQRQTTQLDQWEAQKLLQCLEQATVYLYSALSPEDRLSTRTVPIDDLNETLATLYAESGRARLPVAVLPMGPLTIPVAPQ